LEQAWYSAYDKIKESGLIAIENGEPFEIYKIGPNETLNPSKWITEIYIPVN
jgi:effector-binding domain-containing protein